MPLESTRCAYIGWSAVSIRHIIWRLNATETGAVFSAISAASSCAAGSSSSGGWTLRKSPARSASAAGKHPPRVHPFGGLTDADESRQEPARAGLRHDAPAGEHEADLRVLRREPDVHRQRHRDADADRRAVDRGDDRLLRLEDAQREHASAVADDRLRTRRRRRPRRARTTRPHRTGRHRHRSPARVR